MCGATGEGAAGVHAAFLAPPIAHSSPATPPARLIPHPSRYDELLGVARGARCPHCHTSPDEPALCLSCGAIVCAGGGLAGTPAACCKRLPRDPRAFALDALHEGLAVPFPIAQRRFVGECTAHAAECGGGVGVFLLLGSRSSQVLLIAGAACAYYGSPYVDSHGEEDIDLKRGKPLTLCGNRLAALAGLWASGGVAREVAAVRGKTNPIVLGYY